MVSDVSIEANSEKDLFRSNFCSIKLVGCRSEYYL
jgi:hypothetical protein